MKKTLLRITSMTLALLMVFSVFAGAISVSDFSDFPDDWSTEAMTFAVNNGLLQGYTDNTIAPAKNMTRAEMATVINRAFKAWKTADINFYDVASGDWFYTEVSKAVAFETFQGTSATKFTPNGDVTRAQAFTAIARALKLTSADESALDAFADKADIPAWAKAETAAMAEAGYVQGANGNLRPNAPLTRAEFAQVMYNIISLFVTNASVVADGNVLIVEDGLTLSNVTINGDLIVAANVNALTLKNVTINGRLLVRDQYDLDLTVTKSTVKGGLVAYAPNQVVTVTTDTVAALKANLLDYTTVIFKEQGSTGGGGGGGGGGTVTKYSVTVTAPTNGTISVSPVSAAAGETVTVTATPDAGYQLDQIFVNGNAIVGNTFAALAEDMVVTATFKAIEYNITVTAPVNGSLVADLAKATIGTTVTVTATPDAGYKLDGVYVNGDKINGNTFVMPASDVTVTAEFSVLPPNYYSISIGAVANGSVVVNTTSAQKDETITVTATPNAGYKLSVIKVNGTPIVGNTFAMPAENVVVTAEFEAIEYNVTVTVPANGSLAADLANATIGSTVTVTATPDAGYKLSAIYVNGNKIDGDTFVMPAGDVTITAEFEAIEYSVTVTAPANGSLAADLANATIGNTVTVTATPDAGYKLSAIYVNGNKIDGDTFVMPAGDVTITAEFEAIEYSVTVTAPANGSLAADLANATIGTTVTVTATPDAGYKLSAIYVNGNKIDGDTFVMPAGDVTITAEFEAIEYNITVVAPQNGSLTTNVDKATAGTTITVTATPDTGYQLVAIKVNGSAITGSTFVMPIGDVTVTAEFSALPPNYYAITIAATENGSVESDVTSAKAGDIVTLTITPAKHYRLDKIQVNGSPITGTTFTMPAENVVITATFKAIPYAIRIHYPDTKYAFLLDVPYNVDDTLFTLTRKVLDAAHGPDGGLLLRLYNDGLAKVNEKGYLINGEIPTYEITDHREYDVNVRLSINSDTDIDASQLSGNLADVLKPDVYDNLSPEEQADIFDEMVAEARAELKGASAEEKRDWLLRKLPQYDDDSFAKLLLERIPAADISDAYDSAIDEVPDSAFSLRHEAGSTHYIIHFEYTLNANEFVDGYFVEHLEAEIIDDCREGMKAMNVSEMREWLAERLPASVQDQAMKVFKKIPDRDFDQLFRDGVDMVPYDAFTVIHVPGDNHYSIDMVWDCDPITFADNYYQNVYLKNRVLDKLAAYGIVPNSQEWALYDRLLPSKFFNDMGTHHTLLTFDEYYADVHEILDIAEVAFRSRNYDEFYGDKEKVLKAIEKGIPKALTKAREKGVEIVDDQGVDITAEQCIAAAKALYANPDITVNDLLDIFGTDYVKISGGARGHDTEIMISRIDRSEA
ncbi:MAG: hypothetical protein E7471_04925 [Ruminococcaceae bacterium]|nr:hypothetical protein [Oscillospiraceae bacterium]